MLQAREATDANVDVLLEDFVRKAIPKHVRSVSLVFQFIHIEGILNGEQTGFLLRQTCGPRLKDSSTERPQVCRVLETLENLRTVEVKLVVTSRGTSDKLSTNH